MNQWRIILTLAVVALGSAAIWTWHQGSQPTDSTVVRAQPAAPFQQSAVAVPAQSAASDPSPTPPPVPQAQPAPVASDAQATTPVDVTPRDVDTPEPAQAKFARGGRPDPDQN